MTEISVCLVSRRFYPLYSGAAIRFQRYASGFSKRGIQLQVFTEAVQERALADSGLQPLSQDNCMFPLSDQVDGLPVHRVEVPRWWREPVFFRHFATYCAEQRGFVDVVQFLSLGKWAALWLPRLHRMGIRTVYTATMVGELSSRPWKRALQRIDRRLVFDLVDQVVVSTSVMKAYLKELGVEKPIEVIPNGVDLRHFRPAEDDLTKTALRQKLGLAQDSKIVLYIGPITPRKGIDLLVKAFRLICGMDRSTHLVVVGPSFDVNYPALAQFHIELQAVLTDKPVAGRVHLAGAVNNVKDYLQASDVLVFPSRREGMGNVVLEAMACGIPVVMTPFIGRAPELGIEGEHYVLSNWNPKTLASDIWHVLHTPERAQSLSSAGRKWVEQNMDVNLSLDRYATLYFQLASISSSHRFKSVRQTEEPKGRDE